MANIFDMFYTMTMARRDELGPFEYEVLDTLLRHPRDAYGVTLIERIKEATGRAPSVGALYTTLERLERKGFVRSWWGEPTQVRGGRRKRLYAIDASGAAAVRRQAQGAGSAVIGLAPQRPEMGRFKDRQIELDAETDWGRTFQIDAFGGEAADGAPGMGREVLSGEVLLPDADPQFEDRTVASREELRAYLEEMAIDPVEATRGLRAPEPLPEPLCEPPARAHQVLCLIYPPDRIEEVAGTMEELFHKVAARHGQGFARVFYWWQVGGCVLRRAGALAEAVSGLIGLKRT